MRPIFITLFNHYVEFPGVKLREKELALIVYHGEPYPGESHVRQAVGRVRDFLTKFFQENPEEEIHVEIPLGSYQLRFFEANPQSDITPMEWFWGRYSISESVCFALFQEPLIPEFEAARAPRERHLQISAENLLKSYKMFAKECGKQPDFEAEYSGAYLYQPALAVGSVEELSSDFMESISSRYWSLLVPGQGPVGETYFYEKLGSTRPKVVYRDDDECSHVLVTRLYLNDFHREPTTIILAARGVMIERAIEALLSGATLKHVVAGSSLSEAPLRHQIEAEFQMLLKSSVSEEFHDDLGFSTVDVFEAKPVLFQILDKSRRPEFRRSVTF
jgi:hypothetical protein